MKRLWFGQVSLVELRFLKEVTVGITTHTAFQFGWLAEELKGDRFLAQLMSSVTTQPKTSAMYTTYGRQFCIYWDWIMKY